MNPGQYSISLIKAKILLKRLGLVKSFAPYEKNEVSKQFLEVCRRQDDSPYKVAIQNYDYNILLADDSFFQFSHNDDFSIIRYSFFECPYLIPDYREFLKNYGFSYEEVGDALIEEYQQVLIEAPLKSYFLTIRYDYCEKSYTNMCHPASHIHIGPYKDVRIPVSLVVTPFLFIIFTLKHGYYGKWEEFYEDAFFLKCFRKSRVSCEILNPSIFNELDKLEMYLV